MNPEAKQSDLQNNPVDPGEMMKPEAKQSDLQHSPEDSEELMNMGLKQGVSKTIGRILGKG